MKKITIFILITIFFLSLSSVTVFANDIETGVPNLVSQQKQNKTPGEKAEEFRQNIQKARLEIKDRLQERKDKVKEKLAELKNEQKKRMVETITEQFDNINKVWTDHFSNVLDGLAQALQKIQTRTTKAQLDGVNVTAINAAIQAAQTDIDVARAAVVAQAARVYTPTIEATGETKIMKELREDFKNVKDAEKADLHGLRDGVIKDARTSVQAALNLLKQVLNVDNNTNN